MKLAPRTSRALAWLAVAGLYTAVTLLYLRPIWRVGGDHLAPSLADPLFNLYVLKWSAHQIGLGLPDLWNANQFHPTQGSLALSDHLLGPAALLVLFMKAIPNAIAGYNFLFFTSFVASALAVCWVTRRAGLSWAAALLAGWMFAFSPFRLAHLSHLQILIAQWIPLTLWFWDRLLAERTWKNAALFLLFYLLNVTGGCYLAYMIHFPMLALLINRFAIEKRELFSLRSLRLLVPVSLIAGTVLLALFLPYLRISKSLGLVRTDAEIRRFGATPASYLTPARSSLHLSPRVRGFLRQELGARPGFRPERVLFAGALPTLLFLVGTVSRWRRRRDGPADPWERGLAFAGLLCFALTFPLVYEPLMRVIPGMSSMRAPGRFYVFVSLALAHFAGRGVDFLRERRARPWTRAALAAVLGILLAVELMPHPLRWQPLPREEEFPAVYRWIAREPSVKTIVELPIYDDDDPRENRYIYFSTLHWKPLANGFSGYIPESHRRLTETIRILPDQNGLDLLRELRISHIVVHVESPVRRRTLRKWEAKFAERQVERVYRSGRTSVYRLLDSPSSRNPKRAGR